VKWYRKAADQGNEWAQFNLGEMYEEGDGVPEDAAEAVKWYSKVADRDNQWAQHRLGKMFAKGEGVPKDDAEAYRWYLLAGAQGNRAARAETEKIERLLTPEQRATGQRLAREFNERKTR